MPDHKRLDARDLDHVRSALPEKHPAHAEVAPLTEKYPVLVDLRPPLAFAAGFLPGSYSASDDATLHSLESMLLPRRASIHTLGGDIERVGSAHALLSAAGCTVTHLAGHGISTTKSPLREIGTIEVVEPEQLAVRILGWKTTVVDLRDADEFKRAHTREAVNLPIETLDLTVFGLPLATPLTVVSNSLALSAFGASVLHKQGFRSLTILRDSLVEYERRGLPLMTK